ncbi:tetratricopeptide repeat protein, partial [Myxococcota bacterium]|nr:tetratricopeptide repeat protein [Myxococcota bacterium]
MNLRLTIATVLTTTLLVSCSGPKTEAPKPVFEPPRMGVFISPVPIAESTDDEFEPALIQELGMVVYSVMAAGNQDLYAKTIGGGEPLRLTNHSTNDTDPAISKAPHKIAWTAQSEDVKGDIWIMDLDGSQKKRLTNRQSADRSPVFSADGTHLYFSTQPQGQSYERIEKISLANLQREVVVKKGWDPAISPDGNILFFVQLDEKKKSRIYAKRLLDNKTIALTRGTYPEGMPRVRLHKETLQVVFTRFVDDENGDNSLDADDPSSLWVTELSPSLFDGKLPPPARPLTTGGQSEIFAALGADYMLFTGGQRDGLDIWALPASGVISKDATPELILQAARREEVPSLKRMALRSLIASAPHMASRARYELARDLAEREKWGDAMAELLMIRDNTDIIGTVAAIEYQRLRLLEVTGDSLYLRDPAGRALAQKLKTLIKKQAENPKIPGPAKVRAELSLAELDYATGERLRAAQIFRKIATQTTAPTEDRARAFDRLGQIHEDMGEFEAVADTCQKQLELFSSERHTAHNAARRWVRVATSYTGIPVAASLEHIQSFFGNLSQVAALAAEKLAELHLQAGREDMAIDEWQRIVRKYPSERASLGRALLALGKVFAERNDDEFALATYERIMSKFPETPSLRRKAKLGITRIAFKKAKREESKGQWARARSSYKRLLQTNHELVLAHRRYITISARLRVLHDVIHEYRIAVEQNPQDKFSRYGLGYALTFLSPLPIPEAESEIVKTIELDPRFAPGHLTLGWLKMQREQRKPRSGWLESADGSFRTALELLDHESNLELWAAAQLNRGNALLGLGATGQAFDSYLQRALSGAPFRNPLTQLLFYESFARTALREDKFDVALDMARRAYDHSLLIKGQPRLGTESAMIATIYSKIEFWEDAAWWFKKASDHFSKQGDLDRAIPTLRSRIMALRGAGLNNKALDDTRRLLELLKDGEHPTPFNRPLLSTEAPANPVNVSTAIYGFTPEQEATNAFTLGSRIRVEKLDIKTARDFDAQRIKEFEHFITNKRQAPRIQFEFAHVLHESAHLAWLANQDRESAQKLRRLLQLCRKNGYWNVAQVAIESALRVFSRTPQLIHHPLLQEALAAAHEALAEMATVGENEKAQSFARSLSLLHLAGSYAPRPPLDAKRNILDQSLRHLDQISTHRKDAQLFAYLASGDYFRTNIQAATGESPPCQKVRSDESWRTCYDAALACQNTDDKKLLLKDASERFKSAPGSQHPPELSRFFRDVAHSLIQDGKEEEAWKTLEQLRLLQLQMPTGSELITTSASITKALSGTPASLKAIRKSL